MVPVSPPGVAGMLALPNHIVDAAQMRWMSSQVSVEQKTLTEIPQTC